MAGSVLEGWVCQTWTEESGYLIYIHLLLIPKTYTKPTFKATKLIPQPRVSVMAVTWPCCDTSLNKCMMKTAWVYGILSFLRHSGVESDKKRICRIFSHRNGHEVRWIPLVDSGLPSPCLMSKFMASVAITSFPSNMGVPVLLPLHLWEEAISDLDAAPMFCLWKGLVDMKESAAFFSAQPNEWFTPSLALQQP